MHHLAPSSPPAISLPALSPDLDRAGRIAYFHQLSAEAGRISIMAALAAGIELHRVKSETEHGMFKAWVQRHCKFSHRTATRYMLLAEQVVPERLTALIDDAAPPTIEVLEECAAPIAAKTLTQLYSEHGICRPGKVGGRREGAGRPPATASMSADEIAERAAADAATCANDIAHLLELFCTQEMWAHIQRTDARIFARTLRDRLAVIAAGIESM